MTTGNARARVVCVAILAAGALVASSLAATPAQAAAAPTAGQVSSQLGADTGGYYLDAAGQPVVNVTNDTDAGTVRAAGLRSKRVSYSYNALLATKNSLDQLGNIPDTGWGIDTSADRVVVTISNTTPKAGAARLLAAARQYGGQVSIERSTGHFETFVRGGDAINNGQARCSDGFNVRRSGQLLVLTAGHCTNLGGTWQPMGGTVVASDSPGADSGLISNPSGNGPSQINTGQQITRVAAPTVGERITKSGSTTGVTSGTISAVEQTVNFDVGVIRHLFRTNVHADHGDSGGSGFDGPTALGTLTGGNTTTTFFYPAAREFSMYGLSLS